MRMRPPDVADFEHFALANHLGASESNDATRILPPTSRLTLSVVLSVVPSFSSTFSTSEIPYRVLVKNGPLSRCTATRLPPMTATGVLRHTD